MTQEEIKDYNRRCAEFLGFIPKKYKSTDETIIWCDPKHGLPVGELEFHSDWNWIHEVITKIWKISEELDGNYTEDNEFYKQFYLLDIHKIYIRTQKEAVVQAINSFLKFYNKNLEMSN